MEANGDMSGDINEYKRVEHKRMEYKRIRYNGPLKPTNRIVLVTPHDFSLKKQPSTRMTGKVAGGFVPVSGWVGNLMVESNGRNLVVESGGRHLLS